METGNFKSGLTSTKELKYTDLTNDERVCPKCVEQPGRAQGESFDLTWKVLLYFAVMIVVAEFVGAFVGYVIGNAPREWSLWNHLAFMNAIAFGICMAWHFVVFDANLFKPMFSTDATFLASFITGTALIVQGILYVFVEVVMKLNPILTIGVMFLVAIFSYIVIKSGEGE